MGYLAREERDTRLKRVREVMSSKGLDVDQADELRTEIGRAFDALVPSILSKAFPIAPLGSMTITTIMSSAKTGNFSSCRFGRWA
jgi:hypothetical protein